MKCQDSLQIFPHLCETCINVRNVGSSISSADHRLHLHYHREISGNSIQFSIKLLLTAVFLWGVGRERCKTKPGSHTCHWNHNQHAEVFGLAKIIWIVAKLFFLFLSICTDLLIPLLLSLFSPLQLFLLFSFLFFSCSQFLLLFFTSFFFPACSLLFIIFLLFLYSWPSFRFVLVIPLFLFNVFRFILLFIFYVLSSSFISFFLFPFLLNRHKANTCDAIINANNYLPIQSAKSGRKTSWKS